jgi:hypothetical protein
MIEQRFCNYQRNDQQRLGFLKLVSWAGEGLRGGPEEIKSRLAEFTQDRRRQRAVAPYDHLEVEALLTRPEVPSWLPGIVPKLYGRLVVWAQAVGIIGPTGRLSEWANVLNALAPQRNLRDFGACNPFVLSTAERAFFVHLLFYHDQVLPILVDLLGRLPAGTRIGMAEACKLVAQAMAEFLDVLHQEGPDGLKMRVALRDTLDKITHEYGVPEAHDLINPKTRTAALDVLATNRRPGTRVLTAERQAVCRLEQLTDLRLLTKEDPAAPPKSPEDVRAARRSWTWYTTEYLPGAAHTLRPSDLENFLRRSWIKFSMTSLPREAFHSAAGQAELAVFLDRALPVVRRQIGPVQVHPWAMLTCVLAAEAGVIIEVEDVHALLSALHANPRTNTLVRLGGTDSFRGRNVVVPAEGITGVLAGTGKV